MAGFHWWRTISCARTSCSKALCQTLPRRPPNIRRRWEGLASETSGGEGSLGLAGGGGEGSLGLAGGGGGGEGSLGLAGAAGGGGGEGSL